MIILRSKYISSLDALVSHNRNLVKYVNCTGYYSNCRINILNSNSNFKGLEVKTCAVRINIINIVNSVEN